MYTGAHPHISMHAVVLQVVPQTCMRERSVFLSVCISFSGHSVQNSVPTATSTSMSGRTRLALNV